MKRRIRQRCHFGCVICGCPLYEFDHIFGYDDAVGHKEDEITLLCDQCHKKKTNGLLSVSRVVEADRFPFNAGRSVTGPLPFEFGGAINRIITGNVIMEQPAPDVPFAPVIIDGEALMGFGIEAGRLSFNIGVLDAFGNPELIIQDNELVHSCTKWDVEFVGNRLVIREAHGRPTFEIVFRADVGEVYIARATFWHNGVVVIIEDGYLKIPGYHFKNFVFRGAQSLIVLGQRPESLSCFFHIPNVDRYYPFGSE